MRVNVKRTGIFCICVLGLLAFATAQAMAGGYSLKLAEGSKLWLEGDSTLHAYESDATILQLKSDVIMEKDVTAAAVFAGQAGAGRVASLELTIPVKGLESGVVGLASQMRKALKEKQHPTIVFSMRSYAVVPDPNVAGAFAITAEGDLTLAGVTNAISIAMQGTPENDHVKVKGEHALNMTDFGVEPPTMMFGAIKTDDKVVVKWDLLVSIEPSERSAESIE